MSRIQMLRLFLNERLTAAAEEIFGVFERTIEEYEDEINHHRKQLDALKPEIRTDFLPTQLILCEEGGHPEQQERSPFKSPSVSFVVSKRGLNQCLEQPDVIELTLCPDSMKCENNGEKTQSSQVSPTQDPEPLQIKEEQDQLFHDLEEDDGSRITALQENTLPFQSLQTQREENREAYSLPRTSTEQMKTEHYGQDCGVSEPASNFYPDGDLELTRDGQLLSSDCSGIETDGNDEWEGSGEPQSGLKTHESKKTQESNIRTGVYEMGDIKRHMMNHSGETPDAILQLGVSKDRCCPVCRKWFTQKGNLEKHMRTHTGEKPYSCLVCGKGFSEKGNLKKHLRLHTGEKPFSCSVCGKGYSEKWLLKRHMRSHTGESPHTHTH